MNTLQIPTLIPSGEVASIEPCHMFRIPKQGITVGYVLPSGIHKGEQRAAMITQVFGNKANLTVFLDQTNDVEGYSEYIPFARVWSADYDTYHAPGSWHYID